MNRWLLIRRLRGPAFLLMFGVTALLSEWHILSFAQSWPLYLVLAGVLTLAERAAWEAPNPAQAPQYPPYGYPPQTPAGWQTPPAPGTSMVTTDTRMVQPGPQDPREGGR